jgi:hypothetical protein
MHIEIPWTSDGLQLTIILIAAAFTLAVAHGFLWGKHQREKGKNGR